MTRAKIKRSRFTAGSMKTRRESVLSMTRTCQCHSERFHIANGLACPEESLFMSSERSFCCTPAQRWKKRETHGPLIGTLCGCPSQATTLRLTGFRTNERRNVQPGTPGGRGYANIEPFSSGMLQ